MTVAELVDQLRKLDPGLDVLCYTEDEGLVAPGHGFRLLDIVEVGVREAEPVKGIDQVPSLKFGKNESGQKQVIIELIGDF